MFRRFISLSELLYGVLHQAICELRFVCVVRMVTIEVSNEEHDDDHCGTLVLLSCEIVGIHQVHSMNIY